MKADGRCNVIVKMTAYGVGKVVGGGHATTSEKYGIGFHSDTWQMGHFKPFKG